MYDLLVKNGRIVTAQAVTEGNIGIKDGRIAALLEEFEAALQQEQPQHIREVFRRVKSALDEWEADAVSFFS